MIQEYMGLPVTLFSEEEISALKLMAQDYITARQKTSQRKRATESAQRAMGSSAPPQSSEWWFGDMFWDAMREIEMLTPALPPCTGKWEYLHRGVGRESSLESSEARLVIPKRDGEGLILDHETLAVLRLNHDGYVDLIWAKGGVTA